MGEAILIAAVVAGALACPAMMWLGRRGIGPGCAMARCQTDGRDASLEELEQRQRELDQQVAELDRVERTAAKTT